MKIAFDENVPRGMVRVFQALAGDEEALKAVIVSARDYRPDQERGDEHWVKRFAQDGGGFIISGDVHMRSRRHELAALVELGLVTYFFEGRWSTANFFTKSAMLLHWWPILAEHMLTASRGTCWEIPYQWTWKDLTDVSADPSQIEKSIRNKRK